MLGIGAVAAGCSIGFVITLGVLAALGVFEAYRIVREVWSAGVTEVAWTLSTPSGYVSSLLVAGPLPDATDGDDNQ